MMRAGLNLFSSTLTRSTSAMGTGQYYRSHGQTGGAHPRSWPDTALSVETTLVYFKSKVHEVRWIRHWRGVTV